MAVRVVTKLAGSHCLRGLRGKLPKKINFPASIMVHFGSLEEVLKQAHTNRVKKELDAAIKDVPVEKAEEALQSLSYS